MPWSRPNSKKAMLVIKHMAMAFLFSQYESLVIFRLTDGGLLPASEVPISAYSIRFSTDLSFWLAMVTALARYV